MARRCGCTGTCGCTIAGGSGITVTGNGGLGTPYVVSFTGGGGAACNAIMDCVGANIGNGLVYDADAHRLSVKISTDSGNGAFIGSDGGLYAGAGGGGGGGGVTVDGLATSALVGGIGGMSFLYPENGRKGFEMARNLGIALTTVDVRILRDGTLVASAPTDISTLTDGTGAVANQWASRWERLKYDAKTWFGWNQTDFDKDTSAITKDNMTPVEMPFVEDIFNAVGRDIVLVCNIQPWTAPYDPTSRLLTAVTRKGLQDSVIVTSTVRTDLTAFVSANIATGIVLRNSSDVTANTPAQLITAGIGWVFADKSLSNAQITSYVTSGLQVMVQPVERHNDRTRVLTTIGARGLMSRDPIYATASPALYRLTNNIWDLGTGNMPVSPYYGHLSIGTDSGLLAPNNRGDASSDNDFIRYPGGFNGLVLQGWSCPLPTPTAYTLVNWIQFETFPSSGVGNVTIVFGSPTDHAAVPAEITHQALDTYYELELYSDGGWKLWRADGVSGDTVLGSAAGGGWNGGMTILANWFETHIQVTSTSIIFKVLHGASLDTIFTIPTATYRGPYWWFGKNNRGLSYIARTRNQRIL